MKERILELESLRGLAAMSVALLHFANTSVLTENAFIRSADLMVDFFFVLSGYVIAYNYIDRISDFSSLMAFQARRFWRLYPLHLVTLFAFLALETAQYVYEIYTGSPGATRAFSSNRPTALLTNLLLVHPFFEHELTFNYPSWSISSEFFTYFFFGGIVLLVPRRFHGGVLIVAVLLSGLALNGDLMQTREFAIVRCAFSFCIGALTYRALSSRDGGTIAPYLSAPILVATVAAVCLPNVVPRLFLPLLFAICIASLIIEDDRSPLKRLLSRPALVHLGTISYGIYMIHAIVWEIFNIVLVKIFRLPLAPDSSQVALTPTEHTVLLVLGMAVILVGAHLSFNLIERPWRRGMRPVRRQASSRD